MLTEAVIAAHVQRTDITGSHLFGKATCPHCVRAKNYLANAGIEYIYHDVVRNHAHCMKCWDASNRSWDPRHRSRYRRFGWMVSTWAVPINYSQLSVRMSNPILIEDRIR